MFNTVADLLCVLLHSLHMGKYVAIQGNRSPCCVMRFIVVSFVHVPTAAKRHACRLDVGWTIVCLLQQKGMRRTQSGCLGLRPILHLPQNVHHGNGCGFGTSSCVSAVQYTFEVSEVLCAVYSCSDDGGSEGGMEQVQTAQPR